jgi:hypothetical protein
VIGARTGGIFKVVPTLNLFSQVDGTGVGQNRPVFSRQSLERPPGAGIFRTNGAERMLSSARY